MKKIVLLSGAYGNTGDKLIEKRCYEIIKKLTDGEIVVVSRKEIKRYIDVINNSDIAFFTGGPIYQKDISRNFSIDDVLQLNCPVKIIGGGWWGYGRSLEAPYNYTFQEGTKRFLKKIDENSGLSCRDLYSVKALKNAGFKSVVMTGCPAWYDLDNVHSKRLRDNSWNLKSIFISDPANSKNYYLLFPLIETLHRVYRLADITIVFHRSTESENEKQLIKSLVKYKYVKIIRLDGTVESFDCYKNSDLHIGFRVHAHIFNLSLRKKTILIEEDGRGAGVNEALGLPGLLAYSDTYQPSGNSNLIDKVKRKAISLLVNNKNSCLGKQVENYMEMMERANGIYYDNAFSLMEEYYKSMEKYILDSTR